MLRSSAQLAAFMACQHLVAVAVPVQWMEDCLVMIVLQAAVLPGLCPLPKATANMHALHVLFTPQEITASRYADNVVFEDPISRFTDKNGYMFMIQALKTLFNVTFDLHDVKATQPDQITTR